MPEIVRCKTLKQNTLIYWQMSMSWNQRKEALIAHTAQDVIETCNDIMAQVLESRSLYELTYQLRQNVVMFGSRSHKAKMDQRAQNK